MRTALRVGIVGCGLIGHKRAEVLAVEDILIGCYDSNPRAADTLAKTSGCAAYETLAELLEQQPDVLIIATTHNSLAPLSKEALLHGCNILVEKPAAISSEEIKELREIASSKNLLVKVGFNHRFHPGNQAAIELARSGEFGEIMFARGRYGHGGRLGYEKEWRMQPELSGGGELIDQGMHMLDLYYALFGPLPLHSALLSTSYWPTDVEDNAVITLGGTTHTDPWATFHTSWSEWKNIFSLEIYCKTAKLQVDGLAKSYGPQKLTIYRMKPELGPPEIEVIEYPADDKSWEQEWLHFKTAIEQNNLDLLAGDLRSALYAWQTVEAAYQRNNA